MALPSSHHRPAEPEEFSLFLRLSERPGVLLEGCISILGTERASGGYTIYRVVFKVYTTYTCTDTCSCTCHAVVYKLAIKPSVVNSHVWIAF